ncbi:hypothetical protein NCS56_00897900 [Fusarium sp. Ph1]|nr:hypothetical protein NCS56_01164900 [Fusarium sp. Ph1]KAI8667608.1 hypothetical protein NCS56_00897900 [Fusarium sp. Ph1]
MPPGPAARRSRQKKQRKQLSRSLEGHNLSAITVWRILKAAGFQKTKPTRKPGLTKKMRQERYKWCIAHQDWTLEDWKNVICYIRER